MNPFLLVNSGSGGGKAQDAILAVARERGIRHHVVAPGERFAPVLDAAVSDGADLLLAAGGDGTLCAVANVAMAANLPMVVVPAGTRNHFALDLGLDLEDPAGVLAASLDHEYERHVDVGAVNGSTFLNNVSLGVYASAVSKPDYRDHKVSALVGAAAQALEHAPDRSSKLTLSAPSVAVVPGATAGALMVVNNAYATTFAPGERLRPRLDSGEVWVYVGGAGIGAESGLLTRMWDLARTAVTQSMLAAAFGAPEVVIDCDPADVPVAVDGEHRPDLSGPLRFESRPGALRLRVPQDPGPVTLPVTLVW